MSHAENRELSVNKTTSKYIIKHADGGEKMAKNKSCNGI